MLHRMTGMERGSTGQAMDGHDDIQRLKGFDDFVVKLGDELRGERATRGKSLLDVQRDLRIKASYISAIENCDVSVFPNQGFVAGYVRSYARYLGLDPEATYERFCKESGFKGVHAGLSGGRVEKAKKNKPVYQVLKGAETAPRFDGLMPPQRTSVLETVSPSGIASVSVLLLLISGIGYGGWSLLQDIQRVDFAPVEQEPGISVAIETIVVPDADLSVGEVVAETTGTADAPKITALDRLYRPQELALPRMAPRDGPIAAIDPDSVGVLKPVPETVTIAEIVPIEKEVEEFQGPVVSIEAGPPQVTLLATRAAWVRVYLTDGTVMLEKILEKGERYDIPQEVEAPLLRAGNSGSLFVLVDDQIYGPVGNGTSVAKQVSLSALDVEDRYELAADLIIPADPSVETADAQ